MYNKLFSFAKKFNVRHDFDSDEINILKENFSNIKFNSIPEDWIIIIDDLLLQLENKITSVGQYYGFLVIDWGQTPTKDDLRIAQKAERSLYEIDRDLHLQLEGKDGQQIMEMESSRDRSDNSPFLSNVFHYKEAV